MRKQGFTIVEMLMVIGILGVLVTIITMASSSAIRQARGRRAEAMRATLQAGIATYYAKEGEWPGPLKSLSENGPQTQEAQKSRVAYLSDTDAAQVFQALVRMAAKGTPLLDVSGLFVCRQSSWRGYGKDKHSRGLDFRAAKLAGRKRAAPLATSELYFGYPARATGDFMPFIIKYNFATDAVDVMTQNEAESQHDYNRETGKTWPEQ